jgi:hypothetical protein
MWHKPNEEQMRKIPGLYSTDHLELQDKLIYQHFYLLDSDWFVIEHDGDTFFGFVILNGDLQNAEWGYFTLRKLDQLNVRYFEVEFDEFWQIRPASQVEKIVKAQGWQTISSNHEIQMHRGQHVR